MPGFSCSLKYKTTPQLVVNTHFIQKFLKDKVYADTSLYTYVQDGVLLNRVELQKLYKVENIGNLIETMYARNGETFFRDFRGSFSGMLYDKQKQMLYIYTDHIGDKPIFYYKQDNLFLFASQQKNLAEYFQYNHIAYHPNKAAIYSMLTYGFLLEGMSYIEGVKRLCGGKYLVFDLQTQSLEEKKYHSFCDISVVDYKNDKEIVKHIDELFTHAVSLQINKNAEYGYEDISALSAGLDSRMTTFAIDKLKRDGSYTTFTYSPIGFYDQKTSLDIVHYLKNQKHIYICDECGSLLKNVDETIQQNEGLYMHFGSALLYNFFNTLNRENIGIIHTGQIGDVIVGTFRKSVHEKLLSIENADITSCRHIEKLRQLWDMKQYTYSNRELYSLYNRGFIGVNSGSILVFHQFTETISPFCDVDFCEYCMSIAPQKRVGHGVYDKWVLSYYPAAARFMHNGTRKIGSPYYSLLLTYLGKIKNRTLKLLGIQEKYRQSVAPINRWMQTPLVKQCCDSYFNENIKLLSFDEDLQKDCIDSYTNGIALEKDMAITVLGAIKYLWNE